MNQELSTPAPCQVHGAFAATDLAQLPSSSMLDVDQYSVLWLSVPAAGAAAPSTGAQPSPAPATCDADLHDVYNRELLCELMDLRSSFDAVPRSRYSAARWQSNPYERLGESSGNPYLNRSALKLANMNTIMPLISASSSFSSSTPVSLTFLDLCGGPGGFSEYLLRRRGPEVEVHGWGMTLEDYDCPWDRQKLARWIVGEDEGEEDDEEKEEEDRESSRSTTPAAKRQKTTAAPKQTRTLRFCYGQDESGDLCQPENVQYLAKALPARVDVVVADGGFAEARARFDQEAKMLPLLISEASAMLLTLKEGGSFVCKFFDATLPGTVQLLGVLAGLFDRVAIVKPVTSRPASSERYFLGQGFRGGGGKKKGEEEDFKLRKEEEENEKEEGYVMVLLSRMLVQAQAGRTEGMSVLVGGEEEGEEGEEEGEAKDGWGKSLSLSSLRDVLAPGSAFNTWLRAVNDRLMRAQIQACYAIHAQMDAGEEEGEEEEGEGAEEEGRGRGEVEEKKKIVDVEAYRRAWGLEDL